jgi:hypothetical protein
MEINMRSNGVGSGAVDDKSVLPAGDGVTREEDLDEAEEGESGMSGLSYEYLR